MFLWVHIDVILFYVVLALHVAYEYFAYVVGEPVLCFEKSSESLLSKYKSKLMLIW